MNESEIIDFPWQGKAAWGLAPDMRAIRCFYLLSASDSELATIHNYEIKAKKLKFFLMIKQMRKLTGLESMLKFPPNQINTLIQWSLQAEPKPHIWHGLLRQHRWDMNARNLTSPEFEISNSFETKKKRF